MELAGIELRLLGLEPTMSHHSHFLQMTQLYFFLLKNALYTSATYIHQTSLIHFTFIQLIHYKTLNLKCTNSNPRWSYKFIFNEDFARNSLCRHNHTTCFFLWVHSLPSCQGFAPLWLTSLPDFNLILCCHQAALRLRFSVAAHTTALGYIKAHLLVRQ